MTGRSLIAGLVGALLLAGSSAAPALAEPQPQDVLVRFEPGADAGERAAARQAAGAEFEESLPVRGLQKVDPEPGVSVAAAVRALERSAHVLYAEPDQPRSIAVTPSDSLFATQWGLHNTGQTILGSAGTADADIDAPEAWNLATGSAGITVAVVDTGILYTHTDLSPNIWNNPGETGGTLPTNGVDDDGNGFVDDWRGWDFVQNDNNAQDGNGHGTHVAGTVGANGNDGAGVAGVAWRAGLVPLRVLNNQGGGSVSDLIEAYDYAGEQGLRVLNASLSGPGSSQAESDAIAAAGGTLFVVAAGNDADDNDTGDVYPCNYDLPNLICVAASDQDDALADFSNYGPATVHLAAPGDKIRSTYNTGQWAYFAGTSMASPHVAGAAALALSLDSGVSVGNLRNALLGSVDPKASHAGLTATGGRLNAAAALGRVSAGDFSLPGGSPSSGPGAASGGGGSVGGGGAPTPARTPARGAVDRAPPGVKVRLASGYSISSVLRRGLGALVRCSEACTLRVGLYVSRGTARRLGLRASALVTLLGRGRGGVRAAGSATVKVRLTALARRRLRHSRSLGAALRIRATDRSGNSRTVKKRLLLRR